MASSCLVRRAAVLGCLVAMAVTGAGHAQTPSPELVPPPRSATEQTPFSPEFAQRPDVVEGKGPTFAPGVLPPPLPWLKLKHSQVVGIRLLSARPSSLGGVQPFRVRDVRNDIDPQSRLARLARAGAAAAPGGGTAIVTCPDGTRYPGASTFAPEIAFLLPASGGTCALTAPTGNTDTVFIISRMSPTGAEITGENGWTVSTSTLASSPAAGGVANPIRITRGGSTYSLTVTLQSAAASSGGNATISSFTGM